LDVNYRALYEPTLYAAADVMYTISELDEHYGIRLIDAIQEDYSKKVTFVDFNTNLLDGFLKELQQHKKDLADGVIRKAEYMKWKVFFCYVHSSWFSTLILRWVVFYWYELLIFCDSLRKTSATVIILSCNLSPTNI